MRYGIAPNEEFNIVVLNAETDNGERSFIKAGTDPAYYLVKQTDNGNWEVAGVAAKPSTIKNINKKKMKHEYEMRKAKRTDNLNNLEFELIE